MSGITQLLRPKNCLMAVLSIVIVALVACRFEIYAVPLAEVLAASLVVFMFTGAGNTLNDYLDRDIDRLNHPERPIPAGRVKPRTATVLSGVLFSVSVILGLWLSLYCMLIILLNLAIMLAYEFRTKSLGLSGNIMISWLTASLFLFGGFAVLDSFPSIMEPVLFMFFLSFFATLGREIAKDIQDMAGDVGRKTLPMRIGAAGAGKVASMAFLFGIGLSPLPYFLGIFGFFYLVAVLLADAIFIYGAWVISRNPGKTSESAKLAMFVALLAFLVGVI
ncbi:MAG: UbiA family prenyltransferase [Candidatus Thermoplasmatota archaeon]|nr:geranylgeranylglycerol-phosphate geranylgeranyltransferase [Euryarchaeota archaeon]MBU4033074.1 UbiA family prenyltransferase [Candidatus Thermoplasmatota archaeon]MBU4072334.1 UbiA family prenyltransferase [Candidatus Thermoplasmatota archaeon]MBU4143634.1 UbiA family prenyltransferase [Candidatus Thermoplasmatota archaeon]MBU4591294.1 UbiA family prenyltransferase [Candidatus Thermoplasmatota archaeon]